MAWRAYKYLIGGELEFKDGFAVGSMYFLTAGIVKLQLQQNFILSGKVKFEKPFEQIIEELEELITETKGKNREVRMEAFGNFQEGFLGDFITGKDGNNYQNHFYLDWYSDANGRVVYEGSSDEVKIIEPLVFIPRDQRKTQNYIAQIFLKYFPENSVARKILDGATNTDLL